MAGIHTLIPGMDTLPTPRIHKSHEPTCIGPYSPVVDLEHHRSCCQLLPVRHKSAQPHQHRPQQRASTVALTLGPQKIYTIIDGLFSTTFFADRATQSSFGVASTYPPSRVSSACSCILTATTLYTITKTIPAPTTCTHHLVIVQKRRLRAWSEYFPVARRI